MVAKPNLNKDYASLLLRIRFPCLVIPDKRIKHKEHLFPVLVRHHGYLPDPSKCCRVELANILMYPSNLHSTRNILKRKQECLDLDMDKFRLDRTACKGQTARAASNHSKYYSKLTWKERLEIAFYLNSVAFNFSLDNPPRMDKSKFSTSTRG